MKKGSNIKYSITGKSFSSKHDTVVKQNVVSYSPSKQYVSSIIPFTPIENASQNDHSILSIHSFLIHGKMMEYHGTP